jgi:hypothetical protein
MRIWLTLFLGWLVVGCAGSKAIQRPYPAPDGDQLLRVLLARQSAVKSLNLETRATSWLGGERARGTVQMLVDRRGDLRFEAEVSLQGTVAALAVHEGRFIFIDHQKKMFRQGPATPGNVASMIRIPLQPMQVAAILLGDCAIPAGARVVDVGWDGQHGADVLHMEDVFGQLWITLHRNGDRTDVVAVEGQSLGMSQRWRVAYEDLHTTDGWTFPNLIRFAEPGRSFDDGVEIKVKDRILNPTLPETAFILPPPPGYTLDAPGGP